MVVGHKARVCSVRVSVSIPQEVDVEQNNTRNAVEFISRRCILVVIGQSAYSQWTTGKWMDRQKKQRLNQFDHEFPCIIQQNVWWKSESVEIEKEMYEIQRGAMRERENDIERILCLMAIRNI